MQKATESQLICVFKNIILKENLSKEFVLNFLLIQIMISGWLTLAVEREFQGLTMLSNAMEHTKCKLLKILQPN